MKLNKKGSQMMAWGLLATMFILVITAYIYIWSKTSKFTSTTGETQSEIIKNYHNGELALIYTDQAAKYSIYTTIYFIAQTAGYFSDPSCGYSPIPEGTNYVLWQKVNEKFENYLPTGKFKEDPCYPTESDIRKSFTLSFNKEFNDYAEKYTPTIIPKNNYDLVLNEKEQNLEIVGIATQKIRFPPDRTQYKEMVLSKLSKMEQNCLSKEGYTPIFGGGDLFRACAPCPEKANCGAYVNEMYCKIDPCNLGCRWDDSCKKANSIYAITPSFKTEINYNFIKKFNEYVEKTKEIEKSVVECLKKGSGEPYDTDLMACAEINNLKQIKGIENYKITPLPDDGNYILLFTIEDLSFNNPFSDEKLTIKYGLRFLDRFPPPATEIMADKENKPLKRSGAWYLIWQTNNASDVVGYKIYYKKIEKALDGKEIPSTPPTDIEKMDNKYDPIIIRAPLTEWLITGLEEGDYYFFIIAGDDANNVAYDIITKRVTIPSIEEARKEETLILPIY